MVDNSDLVVVYTGDFSSAGLVKGCLEDGGISAYILDEIMSTMHPIVGRARVAVSKRDVNKAKPIVRRFQEMRRKAPDMTTHSASEKEPGEQPGSGLRLIVSIGAICLVLFAFLAAGRWWSERQSLANRLYRLQDTMHAHYEKGHYEIASNVAEDVLRLAEEKYGLGNYRLVPHILWLAFLEEIEGNYGEVVSLYKRVIELREKAYGQDDLELLEPLFGLARTYHDVGQYSEAEPLYKRIIGIRQKRSGEYHHDVGLAHWRLGILYELLGQYDAAEAGFQQAIEIRSRILGNDHLGVAAILSDYSLMLRKAGKLQEAEQVESRVSKIRSAPAVAGSSRKDGH
jgi:tetratricopeptide (TPR) repeat protein